MRVSGCRRIVVCMVKEAFRGCGVLKVFRGVVRFVEML